jgi:hypothetical protein
MEAVNKYAEEWSWLHVGVAEIQRLARAAVTRPTLADGDNWVAIQSVTLPKK